MNKFIIEKTIIEKTDKDININDSYEFTSNLNLICGANEVGKSSLMNFLRTTLLSRSNTDLGKVFVSISDNHYLIQTKQKAKENTIYSLSENKKIESDFIKKNISEKALEYVFSMNLDDLMAVKDVSVQKLLELLKDSSCCYLNEYLSKTNDRVAKLYGVRGVKNDVAKLKADIISINKKIKEYSNNEKDYNSVVQSLNYINEELQELSKKENLLEINQKISNLNEKINELENGYKSLSVNFNPELIKNSSEYLKLNEKVLNYTNNLEKIRENENKINELETKIIFVINKLKKEFLVDFSTEKLNSFNIDYSKIKSITKSLEKLKSINDDLVVCLNNKEIFEEQISNLNKKIEMLNSKDNLSSSVDELEELYKYIDSTLKYYTHLQNEINEEESKIIIKPDGFISSQKLLIISCCISVLLTTFASFAFYQKMYLMGAFALVSLFLIAIVIYSLKISINKSKGLSEFKNNKLAKDKIVQDLKEKFKDIFPEFIDMHQSLMMLKINDLKQEIFSKKEQLLEKVQDRDEKIKRLNEVSLDINKLETEKEEINNSNKEIIQSDFEKIELSADEYLKIIDLIENVKEVILEKLKLEEINKDLFSMNNEIQNEFKDFVLKNKINIPFENNFSEKIEQLKSYYLENSKLNGNIETIKIKLDSYKEEKENLKNKKEQNLYKNEEISRAELEFEIKNKNKQKEELLGKKNALEHIEGLDDLKIKRNILQSKYDTEISNLLIDKILIELCEKAKSNFDKKQPNLQKAQEFLSIMTDGKYTRINLDNELIQNDSGTIIKKWNDLSRGTKELLFFALKLGFAVNYSKDKMTLEPNGKLDLPLIIDDALVNFDATRTKNAIKCLQELSKTNQVLFFTCHSEVMKKYFEELCVDFNTVNLKK